MRKSNRKMQGLTLVEFIVVIVILGIIAAIVAPVLTGFIKRARVAADQSTLRTLNVVTMAYKYLNAPHDEDAFSGVDHDQERMQVLVNDGFLNDIVRPQLPDAEFIWHKMNQRWLYSVFTVAENSQMKQYLFRNMTKDDFIYNTWGGGGGSTWSINENGLYTSGTNGNDLVFIGMSESEYTLSANFRLEETSVDVGGFGLFFETALNNNDHQRDTGYILQFDRGFSELVLRKRVNGSESTSQGGGILVRIGNRSTSTVVNESIPYKTNDDWWESEKQLSLTVKESDTAGIKLVTITLDGNVILTDFEISSDIDPINNYTGFRSWNNGPVSLYDLTAE